MEPAPPRSPAAVPPVRAWDKALCIGALSGAPWGILAPASRTGVRRAADFPKAAPAIATPAPDAVCLSPGRPVGRKRHPACRDELPAESVGLGEVRALSALSSAGRALRPLSAGGRPRVVA